MREQDQLNARQLLEGVVSDELLSVYTRLLAVESCREEEAVPLLGGPCSVKELISCGMARRQPSDLGTSFIILPIPPDLVLQNFLSKVLQQVTEEQNRVLTGHRRLAEVRARLPALSESTKPTERLVQVITDHNEVGQISASFTETARHEWLALENSIRDPSPTGITFPAGSGEQVRLRAIYETRYAERPAGARDLDAAVRAGGQVRLLPRVRMRMKLVDGTAALLFLSQTRMPGALLIRSQVIVTALREYFELLWERAMPFGNILVDGVLSPVQTQVLRLLALGLSDEVIAQQLELSINTIRRHCTTIREELDAETRFAAGVAAARRGWVV